MKRRWIWSGAGEGWAGEGDGMIGKAGGNGKEERKAGVGEREVMGEVGSVFGMRWGRERKCR